MPRLRLDQDLGKGPRESQPSHNFRNGTLAPKDPYGRATADLPGCRIAFRSRIKPGVPGLQLGRPSPGVLIQLDRQSKHFVRWLAIQRLRLERFGYYSAGIRLLCAIPFGFLVRLEKSVAGPVTLSLGGNGASTLSSDI